MNQVIEEQVLRLAIEYMENTEMFSVGCKFEEDYTLGARVKVISPEGIGMIIEKASVVDCAMGTLISNFYLTATPHFELSEVEREWVFPFEVPDFDYYYRESLKIKNLKLSHALNSYKIICDYIRSNYQTELDLLYSA